jgi:hypothetical protein
VGNIGKKNLALEKKVMTFMASIGTTAQKTALPRRTRRPASSGLEKGFYDMSRTTPRKKIEP